MPTDLATGGIAGAASSARVVALTANVGAVVNPVEAVVDVAVYDAGTILGPSIVRIRIANAHGQCRRGVVCRDAVQRTRNAGRVSRNLLVAVLHTR